MEEKFSADQQPQFKHDCDKCVYLGHFTQSDHCNGWTAFDLYFCRSTVVARYGDDGPDYLSGMEFGVRGRRAVDSDGNEVSERNRPSYPLIIARDRAIERGLIPPVAAQSTALA